MIDSLKLVGAQQKENKRGGLLVNPLIDGLMVNGEPGEFDVQSYGNKLWRAYQGEVFFHGVANKLVLKPLSLMGFPFELLRSFLSFVRQVIAGINRCLQAFGTIPNPNAEAMKPIGVPLAYLT